MVKYIKKESAIINGKRKIIYIKKGSNISYVIYKKRYIQLLNYKKIVSKTIKNKKGGTKTPEEKLNHILVLLNEVLSKLFLKNKITEKNIDNLNISLFFCKKDDNNLMKFINAYEKLFIDFFNLGDTYILNKIFSILYHLYIIYQDEFIKIIINNEEDYKYILWTLIFFMYLNKKIKNILYTFTYIPYAFNSFVNIFNEYKEKCKFKLNFPRRNETDKITDEDAANKKTSIKIIDELNKISTYDDFYKYEISFY